jgi:predicted TIM-barrel fold metal-dependent hydrolase
MRHMAVVDFQHHFVPAVLADRFRRGDSASQQVGQGQTKVNLNRYLSDPAQQIADMDEAGIDTAVLSCLLAWDAPLEDCRVVNDAFAELQADHPGRFVGLAHVPAPADRAALGELDRAVNQLGLPGVTITSQVCGEPLDSPELWDLYEWVCDRGLPVFVHPAMPPTGYRWITDHDLDRIIGRELDLALQTTRLIAGGVLDRFPALRLVIAHFGGGIAAVKERLAAKAYRFSPSMERSFDEYFDLLYFDMAGFEGGTAALACALTGIRPDRLVFATDYPQDFTGSGTDTGKGPDAIRRYVSAISSLDLRPGEAEAMLGGTATHLLRLD